MKKTIRAAALTVALAVAVPALSFADEMDDLFSDASTEIEQAKVVDDLESSMFTANPFTWSGDLTLEGGAGIGYTKTIAESPDWANPNESLLFNFKTRLWFDARPDKNFRVFGKFAMVYPFKKDANLTVWNKYLEVDELTNISVNNIEVFEIFADFNWKEALFFRAGKQNVSWGSSYFYQVADPLSVGVKDPTDPTADLEGPFALKVSLPFGLNSVTVIGALKESYVKDLASASIKDFGVGAKGDFYVKVPENKLFGNGQLSLAAYYQRNLSPRFVGSYTMSVGKFQLFTDQVVTLGLDSYRLASTTVYPGIYDTEKPGLDKPFYSATAGFTYMKSDWDLTVHGEYFFNGAGSTSKTYYKDWMYRYGAEQPSTMFPTPLVASTLTGSDLGGYLGAHNSALSVSWSELFQNDHFSFSTTWLQNWCDLSGMIKPSITWMPFKHFSIEAGAVFSWGDDQSEWVLKTTNRQTGKANRTLGYLMFKLTDAKF
ncbi:MAG TPA: hypothetical protein PKO22_03715 [Treponemataceae bacterium]|nr:hypothetical protein [Treponemataceae bacterium]